MTTSGSHTRTRQLTPILLRLCLGAVLLCGLLSAAPAPGQSRPPQAASAWNELGRLVASDLTGEFGYTVAVSGDTIAVGAQGDDEQAGGAGAVYVFTKPGTGWADGTQAAKLTASDAAINDGLGGSVSISGDTIVAGAAGDGLSGSAYVFVKPPGGWSDMTETAKLTPSDGASSAEFGISVGISGDTIVVGARGDDDNGTSSGSAYVFTKPPGGWATGTENAKLTASDGDDYDYLGNAVAIDGGTIVAGAHGDDDRANAAGAAYVFARPGGGWTTGTETAKLTASDGAAQDFFGMAVAVEGDTVVAGASADDVGSNADQGSAYVFKRGTGWTSGTETAKLTASDGALQDEFGKAVAVSGDVVVAGAHYDDWGTGIIFNEGSAYVFEKPGSGWADMTETASLRASDGEASDEFGMSVALDGSTLVIGCYRDGVGGSPDQGSAYVFGLFLPKDFLYLPMIRG
jgi:hypothetical protein